MTPLARFADRTIPNEAHCPVPNELIGRLYRAAAASVGDIVASLAPAQRAELALFCYGRAHLRGDRARGRGGLRARRAGRGRGLGGRRRGDPRAGAPARAPAPARSRRSVVTLAGRSGSAAS
ncbi:MAG: hypothetical protein M5U07_21225 [Xanthobacteraceae bacterium]|nr:hypothetical protein [Xanthobacteraceae bacterium]